MHKVHNAGKDRYYAFKHDGLIVIYVHFISHVIN